MIPGLEKFESNLILEYFKQFPEINKIVLYGSRARGDHKQYSDIDLCIYSSKKELPVFLIKEDLNEIQVPYFFDVVQWEQTSNQKFKDRILRDGIVIYDTQSTNLD